MIIFLKKTKPLKLILEKDLQFNVFTILSINFNFSWLCTHFTSSHIIQREVKREKIKKEGGGEGKEKKRKLIFVKKKLFVVY